MEDPTALQSLGEDEDGETEEEQCLRRLKYLLAVPEELETNVQYLLDWTQVGERERGGRERV